MKTKNPRAAAFYQLPEDTRLAVVVCLDQEKNRLGKTPAKTKTTVQDVAARVGLAVGVYERLLRSAKGKQIIETIYVRRRLAPEHWRRAERFLEATGPVEASSQAELLAAARTLAARHNVPQLKALHVVQSGTGDFDVRLRRFGKRSGPLVEHVLRPAKSVGVTWGGTLLAVIRGCSTKALCPRAKIFPLSGCKPEFHAEPWTSSNLVKWIQARRRPREKPLSLEWSLPAVPRSASKRQFIETQLAASDYARIFGGGRHKGLVVEMDAVLTSIGRLRRPWGMDLDALVKLVGISRPELNGLSPGDIGGVLLPRRALTSVQTQVFRNAQKSWLGLTEEILRRVVAKAAVSSAPGVCVVAAGHEKAPLLLMLIERGLVSQAIVDHALAASLARLLRRAGIRDMP